ncbi:hypothetical protein SNE40_018717 [Patella caerulea]|uniref:Uncharacterized protein n=1 Tax=Patella caerulea TaxID=87958 RepID=A0AAN8J5E3_PATCE
MVVKSLISLLKNVSLPPIACDIDRLELVYEQPLSRVAINPVHMYLNFLYYAAVAPIIVGVKIFIKSTILAFFYISAKRHDDKTQVLHVAAQGTETGDHHDPLLIKLHSVHLKQHRFNWSWYQGKAGQESDLLIV